MINTYAATVIPYHGAWLEYETDANDVFYVRIDKNRKLPITWFIKAMGAYDENRPSTWLSCVKDPFVGVTTNERIKEVFGEDERIISTLDKDTCDTRDECLLEIYRKLRPGDPPTVESAETLLDGLFFDRRRYEISDVGRYKFNKKLSLFPRIAGFELAAPVATPSPAKFLPTPAISSAATRRAKFPTPVLSTFSSMSTARPCAFSPTAWWTFPAMWTLTRQSSASRKRFAASL